MHHVIQFRFFSDQGQLQPEAANNIAELQTMVFPLGSAGDKNLPLPNGISSTWLPKLVQRTVYLASDPPSQQSRA